MGFHSPGVQKANAAPSRLANGGSASKDSPDSTRRTLPLDQTEEETQQGEGEEDDGVLTGSPQEEGMDSRSPPAPSSSRREEEPASPAVAMSDSPYSDMAVSNCLKSLFFSRLRNGAEDMQVRLSNQAVSLVCLFQWLLICLLASLCSSAIFT